MRRLVHPSSISDLLESARLGEVIKSPAERRLVHPLANTTLLFCYLPSHER